MAATRHLTPAPNGNIEHTKERKSVTRFFTVSFFIFGTVVCENAYAPSFYPTLNHFFFSNINVCKSKFDLVVKLSKVNPEPRS